MTDRQPSTMPLRNDAIQVVYAALSVGVQLSARIGLNLREVKRLVEVGCFHEGRRRGLKLREIAEMLEVSHPKVGLLSRQFKAHFAAPETERELPRRILILLWAEALTRQGVARALEDFDEAEVDAALTSLVAEGRVEILSGRTQRYQVQGGSHRLVDDAWLARLDAIRDMMSAVARTVERRIFDEDPRAFARAIQVDVLPEDIPRLQAFYQDALFPLLNQLNESAGHRDDAVRMRFSIMWAPDGPAHVEEVE